MNLWLAVFFTKDQKWKRALQAKLLSLKGGGDHGIQVNVVYDYTTARFIISISRVDSDNKIIKNMMAKGFEFTSLEYVLTGLPEVPLDQLATYNPSPSVQL